MIAANLLFKEGAVFEPTVTHAMSVAFDKICMIMNVAPDASNQRKAIATLIIALARDGAFEPNVLCDRPLREVRRPQ